MLKATLIKLFTVTILSCLLGSTAQAQGPTGDQPIPFDVRKTGVVNVMRGPDGQPSGIMLVVTSYNITMDEASATLADLDGYKVRVSGTFSFDEENRRWITVKDVETLAAPEPVKQEEAPAEEPAEKPAEKSDAEKPAVAEAPAAAPAAE
ncbi:MAG: hypothetical protein ABR497_12140 [Kiritimatiellia bacterium]|nr:hypothetical protein [Lentisphaerota bacterium]